MVITRVVSSDSQLNGSKTLDQVVTMSFEPRHLVLVANLVYRQVAEHLSEDTHRNCIAPPPPPPALVHLGTQWSFHWRVVIVNLQNGDELGPLIILFV